MKQALRIVVLRRETIHAQIISQRRKVLDCPANVDGLHNREAAAKTKGAAELACDKTFSYEH